jgi:hypothetical protein
MGIAARAAVASSPVSAANRSAISAPSASRLSLRAELVAYSARCASAGLCRKREQNACHSRSFWMLIITTFSSRVTNGP